MESVVQRNVGKVIFQLGYLLGASCAAARV